MTGRERLRAALRRFSEGGGVLLGEAVGVHGVTDGLTQGVVRTPLSETATVGVAVGHALAGRRVVVELVDPQGLARATDVLADLAGLAARSNGSFSAPIVIRAPWADVAVPAGIAVAVAGVGDDVVGLLEHALASGKPTVILESATALDADAGDGAVPGLGVAVARSQGDVTVLTLGDGVAAALAVEGAEVVDLRGTTPDRAVIAASVRRTGRAVSVGAPAALLVALQEAFLSLEAPLVALPASAEPAAISAAVTAALTY